MAPVTSSRTSAGSGVEPIDLHEHHFGQHEPAGGEARTKVVVALTAATMGVEIVAGLVFGSMALLADGLHMASHAAALGLAVIAYVYARKRARDARFSFGTGKVNALAGFASAVVLALFALLMAGESVHRVSVVILRDRTASGSGHGHHHRHDHNLRAAHLHVLADTLTSLLAIFALFAAKFLGALWMDPLMGIVGGLLVARWSWGLIRQTAGVLLDRQAPATALDAVTTAVESDPRLRVVDLHVWAIGPGYRAAIISVAASEPCALAEVAGLVPADLGIAHLTVEIRAE
jgi:Co/Zn/Cd efflux system component